MSLSSQIISRSAGHDRVNMQERTKNAQFIVISLRNNMFELAARLVGIYKTSNMVSELKVMPDAQTKSITIDNNDYLGLSSRRE